MPLLVSSSAPVGTTEYWSARKAVATINLVLEVYLSKAVRRRETGSAPTGVVEERASTGQLTWRDEREENE